MSSKPMTAPDELEIVVQAKGLGKAYQIYHRPHDRLKQMLWGSKRQFFREFWALRDVDLELRRGQTVGIIGRNGSGKSTLLQMICGTLRPTEGQVMINGRVAALLELGAGFNPDFSGRDNVYLYGSVLGLSRQEIDAKLDQILAFAEIGTFIDMPVKTYSSGMYVRLAFSVAINVDPDILIVDEALAVGDGRFQHRCMARIKQLQDEGVSILYVSHDAEGVKRLCNHVLVLQDGRVVNEGKPLHMSNWYLALMTANYDLEKLARIEAETRKYDDSSQSVEPVDEPDAQPAGTPIGPADASATVWHTAHHGLDIDLPEFKYFRHGDGHARITDIYLADDQGHHLEVAFLGAPVTVNIAVEFVVEQPEYVVGLMIRDRLGTDVIALNSYQERASLPAGSAGDKILYSWRLPLDLKSGFYSLSVAVAYDQFRQEWMDFINNALIFRVVDRDVLRTVFGIYLPAWREITCRKLSPADASDHTLPLIAER